MSERAVVVILLNAVWQPLIIAGATYVVLRFARNASAATRCAVLAAALFAALLLPLGTSIQAFHAPTLASTTHDTTEVVSTDVVSTARVPQIRAPRKEESPSPWHMQRPVFELRHDLVLTIAALWAAITLGLLMRLAISFAYLERLKRDALPIPVERRSQLQAWNEKAGGTTLRLCVSDEATVPIAVGWFDAMVLIPRHLLEDLDAADLDRIVLHEMAHLRRHDSIVHAVQNIGSALFFFSPGLAWITRQLDIEREVACDDWVIERRSEATPYASCLVRLAESAAWPHRALPAPGAFVTRKSMSIRIERILSKARNACLRPSPGPLAAILTAIAIAASIAFSISPTLAYTVDAHPTSTMPPLDHSQPSHRATRSTVRRPAVHRPEPSASPVHVPIKPSTHFTIAYVSPPPRRAPRKPAILAESRPSPRPVRSAPPVRSARPVRPAAPARSATQSDYIGQMQTVFGKSLTPEQLVALKSLDVTPQFVQGFRDRGYQLSINQFVTARAIGLTPGEISDLRNAFGTISFNDAVALTSLHADATYRSMLESAGLHGLTPRQVIQLKSVGVTPDFIKQANGFGFGTLNASRLVELRALDIDGDFIARVRAHNFPNLTLEQIIQLKTAGVIK